MAYEPKTWVTGEVITADALNHMESGIGTLYITETVSGDKYTLSVSYNDILNAFNAGKFIVLITERVDLQGTQKTLNPLVMMGEYEGYGVLVTFSTDINAAQYKATDKDTLLSYTQDIT